LVAQPDGTKPVGKHTVIDEDNNKTNLKDVNLENIDWVNLAYNRASDCSFEEGKKSWSLKNGK
jgi:hypothetical protein